MTLSYSLDDSVAVVAFDDGKANALGPGPITELTAMVDRAEGEARALVLHGRPGVLCAGFDLKVMRSGAEPMRELVRAGGELLLRLFRSPLPVVIGCTGHALAAGALLLLTADHRVGPAPVDDDGLEADGPAAKIGLNEVAIGLRLPIFAVELARHRLSTAAFERSTVQAHLTDAPGAQAAGFLDELAEPVITRAVETAQHLAKLDPRAFAATKALARAAVADLIERTLDADIASLDPPPATT